MYLYNIFLHHMTFTHNTLLNFAINLIIIYSLKLLPIIILFFVLYFLRKINKIKNTEYSYKILDFDFNGFCIIFYVLCYFCLILWIRFKYLSHSTDLKLYAIVFKEKYLISYSLDSLINLIFFVLLLMCIFYFFRFFFNFSPNSIP